MTKIILIGIVLITLGAIMFVRGADPKTPALQYSDASSQRLETIREKHNVPALAVVVAKDGQIRDRAAVGVRKWDDATRVTTNDLFHIGSCTKSMTATLAAILIDEGKLRWDTTIAEVFPELKGKMDKQYEAVTVEQLLHHRGGVPGEPPSAAWKRAWQEIGTPTQQRREFIESVLKAPPEAEPGTKKIYSNQGYTIVGAMLEKITGQDFESLLTERLFKPLHMDTAGFGPPGSKNKVDQPWGHTQRSFKIMPVQADNPPAITPAGRVYCSLDDLARYAMLHLQPTNKLLRPETMARLHAAPKGVEIKSVMDNYACGWVRMKRSWAGGSVLWHNGSNTMWYTVMWLAPEKNFCVIAATNIAGDDAEKACDDACVMMIKKWLPDSKQNVFHELRQVCRLLAMFTHCDHELSLETVRQMKTRQVFLLPVDGQSSDWNKAHTHAERNEIDDEVEAVELHGWFNLQTTSRHPPAQLAPGVGGFFQQQPILLLQPCQSRGF